MQMQAKQVADGDRTNARLGRGLGLVSIGLGLAELAAPRAVAELIGIDRRRPVENTLRAFGAREILTGLGLLAKPQSSFGPWARVFGDIIDLAFLGWALGSRSADRNRTIGAIVAVAGVAALDAYAGLRRQRALLGEPVRQVITIDRRRSFTRCGRTSSGCPSS